LAACAAAEPQNVALVERKDLAMLSEVRRSQEHIEASI
jgi:hypothetical protein